LLFRRSKRRILLRQYLSKHLVASWAKDNYDDYEALEDDTIDIYEEEDEAVEQYWSPGPPERGAASHSAEDLDEEDDLDDESKDDFGDLVATRLSVELLVYGCRYAQTVLENETYLRDAILDGLRYDHDECLDRNLYRFKVKMVLGGKDTLWRWKSYDAYARRSNAYHDEIDDFISRVKNDLLPNDAWRARPPSSGKYLWHDGEFASFNDDAVRLVDRKRLEVDRRYPLQRDSAGAAGLLSRAAFYQRDRTVFSLFKSYLTAPIRDPKTGALVNLPWRSYHDQLYDLDKNDAVPCLIYAATDILRRAPDIRLQCRTDVTTDAGSPPHKPTVCRSCGKKKSRDTATAAQQPASQLATWYSSISITPVAIAVG